MSAKVEEGSFVAPAVMRKHGLFIDESGHAHHTNVDPNNPFLTVCGVLFNESSYRAFRSAFRELKKEFFGRTDVVLHSRDIRKKQGAFRILVDEAINVYFIKRLNEVITAADFEIVAVVVDKKHYEKVYPFSTFDIYLIALEIIMERMLYRLQPKELGKRTNIVKILAEARGGKEDVRLLRAYNRIMDKGNKFNEPERFRDLFTGLNFKRKVESIDGLELADLCAYPIGKHVEDPLNSHPSFAIIEPKLMKARKRGADGVGIKRFPELGATKSYWIP